MLGTIRYPPRSCEVFPATRTISVKGFLSSAYDFSPNAPFSFEAQKDGESVDNVEEGGPERPTIARGQLITVKILSRVLLNPISEKAVAATFGIKIKDQTGNDLALFDPAKHTQNQDYLYQANAILLDGFSILSLNK